MADQPNNQEPFDIKVRKEPLPKCIRRKLLADVALGTSVGKQNPKKREGDNIQVHQDCPKREDLLRG